MQREIFTGPTKLLVKERGNIVLDVGKFIALGTEDPLAGIDESRVERGGWRVGCVRHCVGYAKMAGQALGCQTTASRHPFYTPETSCLVPSSLLGMWCVQWSRWSKSGGGAQSCALDYLKRQLIKRFGGIVSTAHSQYSALTGMHMARVLASISLAVDPFLCFVALNTWSMVQEQWNNGCDFTS